MQIDENILKDAFAAAWVKFNDPWLAAREVVGTEDSGKALYISNNWQNDERVLGKKAELLGKESAFDELPSKLQAATEAYNDYKEAKRPEDRARALQLYSRLMGYIDKDEKKKGGFKVIQMSEADAKL